MFERIASDLHERLVEILTIDLDHDYVTFTVGAPERLRDDGGGFPTWRGKVGAQLADKPFGRVQLDVAPRARELHDTDRLAIPDSVAFAGVPGVEVEAVDIHRHAAEKFHGMLRDFGERENSRVRDLVDLIILLEHGLLVRERTAAVVRSVWLEPQQHRTTGRSPTAARVVAGPLPANRSQPRHEHPALPRRGRPRNSAVAAHVSPPELNKTKPERDTSRG
jgi:hypothetical protein